MMSELSRGTSTIARGGLGKGHFGSMGAVKGLEGDKEESTMRSFICPGGDIGQAILVSRR